MSRNDGGVQSHQLSQMISAKAALKPPTLGLPMVDRYLLKLMAPPMAAALAVVLIALLLERILRLFNLLAASNARFELILDMVSNLVPHYLGLALPAAFFISVFLVIARLGDNNEVDALLASGMSITRLALPFMGVGAFLTLFSVLLFGFIQPYGRYGFNADLNAALNSGWDARVQPRTFVDPGRGFTLTADKVDPTGRRLEGVFVRRLLPTGQEEVITAGMGALNPSEDGRRLTLVLQNAQQFRERGEREPVVGGFDRLTTEVDFSVDAPPFRARGGAERELTLLELRSEMKGAPTAEGRVRAASEFYARMVRSLSLPLLPLLAMPLGMAAKRGRRGPGIVIAAVVMLLYQHGIQLGQSFADTGRAGAFVAVWTPFAVFASLCGWLFWQSRRRPGETPFTVVVDALSDALDAIARVIRPNRPKAAVA
jgi:lipopolysaccharide export system permease protein